MGGAQSRREMQVVIQCSNIDGRENGDLSRAVEEKLEQLKTIHTFIVTNNVLEGCPEDLGKFIPWLKKTVRTPSSGTIDSLSKLSESDL